MEETKNNWYDRNYKLLLSIPLILLLFSIIYLIIFNSKNGDVIYKDISITGGTSITVFDKNIDIKNLKLFLQKNLDNNIIVKRLNEFTTGTQKGFIVETKVSVNEIKEKLSEYLNYELTQENSSIEFSSSSLSKGFYQQLRLAILLAFIFMGTIVFFIFKSFVPSIAVILSAFADIVMTLSVVNLSGEKLSIAGVIAFLMLIGYSVDTDILLTTRVVKRKEGSVNQRLFESFKTGIMMTITSIIAIGVSLYITSGISDVLKQIFSILLIGLGFDILNTWLGNAGILKLYVEKNKK